MDSSDSTHASHLQNPSDYTAILVPGLDYVNNGHLTGADLKVQRQLFEDAGLLVHFVTIPPLGSVEESAKQIAEAVRSVHSEQVLLGGPSSAGPAIHLALAKLLTPVESQKVKAWVNLGGVLQGSPVVDWVDSPPTSPLWRAFLWAKNWQPSAMRSLRSDISRARAATLKVPPHIKTLNYIGLSLSGNISRFAMDKYCIMKKMGPNDGLALLPEMVAPHSVTLLAPTSDHFFAEDPDIRKKSLAILRTTLEML